MHGRRVTGPPEEMALVFQEYGRSLMPWTSVRNNVLLPLRHKKLARSERTRLVEESLVGGRARRLRRPLPVAALGRDAAARGDRAGARLPAVDPAHGRAVRLGRRPDARRPGGSRAAGAGGVRRDDRLRHARHRRVGLPLRPHRRADALPDGGEGDHPGRRCRHPATRSRRRSSPTSRTCARTSTA